MKARSFVFASLAFLFAFFTGTAIAQQCSHAAGNWVDNYGFVWGLTQNGTNVSGAVRTACPYPEYWAVYGTYEDGELNVSAYNPYFWSEPVCNWWFSYQGSINKPGCHTGDGTWWNDYGYSNDWAWAKPCEVPGSETNSAWDWNDAEYMPTVAIFEAILVGGSSGPNYGGRTVSEHTAMPGSDWCHFPESIYDPYDDLGIYEGRSITLDNTSRYFDKMGRNPNVVEYYRNEWQAPCTATVYQLMRIDCAMGTSDYKNNTHTYTINETTVQSTRSGATMSRTWP